MYYRIYHKEELPVNFENKKEDTDATTISVPIAYAPAWAQSMADAFKAFSRIQINGVTYQNT